MRQLLTVFLATATLAALGGRSAAQGARISSLDTEQPTWNSTPLRVGGSVPLRVSWSRSSIVLASAFTASLLMDAGQTRGLARGGWQGFREANPILGRSPSLGRINVYTAVAGLTVLSAAAVVPARVRPWLLGAALVVESLAVARNAQAGIAITLP
jgi:hypothetical protein